MPFAFVDLDLLGVNSNALVQRAGDKPIRIASKSIRSVAILKHILGLNTAFQGIMCYSAAEAVHLSRHGLDDLLVAYPTWDESQVDAVSVEVGKGKTIILMVDCAEHVTRLNAIAARNKVTLRVCLDVDLSMDLPGLHFGVWRSPISRAEQAARVYEIIASCTSLRLEGIMGYEAQVAGVGDKGTTIESRIIRLLKRRSIPQLRERRKAVVDLLTTRGAQLRIINGGGTGSLESTSREDCVSEVTAGSGFYSPTLFDQFAGFTHLPAAGFAIEIVRQPQSNIYTCAGGGYIASGAAGKTKLPQPYLPRDAKLTAREAAGEVQTPVFYAGGEHLSLGDPIFMRHAKAGELCEHFSHLLLIANGKIVDTVPTYRGEGCKFL